LVVILHKHGKSFYYYFFLDLDLEIKTSGEAQVSFLVGLPQLFTYFRIAQPYKYCTIAFLLSLWS